MTQAPSRRAPLSAGAQDMRIALIADTHGTLDPRVAEAVCGVDLLIHAGDVGTGIADALTQLAADRIIVRGNNDPAGSGWPESVLCDLPGGCLAVMHGHQWPARIRHRKLREHFADARGVVCGHSHRRVAQAEAEPWLLNPGAAGWIRAYGGPGWIELRARQRNWSYHVHSYEPLPKKHRRVARGA